MKTVEFWRWRVWNNTRTRYIVSTWRMDEATALAYDPDAKRVPEHGVEMRELPETDDERFANSPSHRPTRASG